ncbi:MAG: glycosyltransferase family 39 protein [Phaeodactylibacter sp.]|nr:glycosyltransferase family 39 protein [Phaeodactylibacter sp.]MCB9273149.1 glycosyltransferase family 39 protein [Lewinellaceae bacterium]
MPEPSLPLARDIKRLYWLASFLVFISLFVNLGKQPVYLEEPRRAMIAMEMEENGNFIVPMQLGEYYYAKPPLFNWVVWASSRLTGGYNGWALRLPTALSLIGASLLLFLLGRRYVNEEFAWLGALLYPTCAGLYFYFSLLGEIDLFYALLTLGSFAALFHFQQKGQYLLMFTVSYALAGLGTLAKGLPSLLFLGLSVLAWLWYTSEWKRLFSLAHLAGIFAFGAIVGGYMLAYHQYNDIGVYLRALFSESSERTAAEHGLLDFLKHLLTFPLETLKDLPPGLFLLVFALRPGLWSLLKRNPYLAFAGLILLVNYLPYWLSPGARQRYIYMLYPFIFLIGAYAYQHRDDAPGWQPRTFRILSGVVIALVGLGSLALNFVPGLDFLPYRLPLSLLSFTLLALAFFYYLRRPRWSLPLLIIAAAIGRLIFGLTVLPQRAHQSAAQKDIQVARDIAHIVDGSPLYIYADGRISFSTIFHLNLIRGRTLHRSCEMTPGAYYLYRQKELPEGYPVLMDIPYEDTLYVLTRLPLDGAD